ncbi:MAG: IS1595 family transposase [Pseudomonadota bacterium]
MKQHFLISSQARSLSLAKVARMSDDEAYDAFCRLRWVSTDGQPVCPRCGCVGAYSMRTRRKFKCKARECQHQFSVTSGTIFASRKLPIRDYLLAIAIFVNGAKGYAALQLSRDLDVQYKTAFVLTHKIREAIGSAQTDDTPLNGEVEVDGAYFGGHIRPKNQAKDRIDRRRKKYQTGKRRVVVVARERRGRTKTFVHKTEGEGVSSVNQHVATSATIHADEASHWDALHMRYLTKRINHAHAYSTDESNTNQAESFFSRLRRAEVGTHHHISGQYLDAYALEMAWREDNRRISNGEQFLAVTNAALEHPVSRRWKGYWQRAA